MGAYLGRLSTAALAEALREPTPVVLLPVGSVEPHGPHLPLITDTLISEGAARRAAVRLGDAGLATWIAPAVAYGVTDFAAGFSGAISVPPAALTAFLRAVVEGYLATGFAHVCVVNNHLEPAHDSAVRAAIEGLPRGSASVACPLTRRWARTLGAEFKSGACHAGRYETSLALAEDPSLVDEAIASSLPALSTSLSEGIARGQVTFEQMGISRAYTGAPSEASAAEGEALYERLATMIVTEVQEAIGLLREA